MVVLLVSTNEKWRKKDAMYSCTTDGMNDWTELRQEPIDAHHDTELRIQAVFQKLALEVGVNILTSQPKAYGFEEISRIDLAKGDDRDVLMPIQLAGGTLASIRVEYSLTYTEGLWTSAIAGSKIKVERIDALDAHQQCDLELQAYVRDHFEELTSEGSSWLTFDQIDLEQPEDQLVTFPVGFVAYTN